jgi:hypothetical protein
MEDLGEGVESTYGCPRTGRSSTEDRLVDDGGRPRTEARPGDPLVPFPGDMSNLGFCLYKIFSSLLFFFCFFSFCFSFVFYFYFTRSLARIFFIFFSPIHAGDRANHIRAHVTYDQRPHTVLELVAATVLELHKIITQIQQDPPACANDAQKRWMFKRVDDDGGMHKIIRRQRAHPDRHGVIEHAQHIPLGAHPSMNESRADDHRFQQFGQEEHHDLRKNCC